MNIYPSGSLIAGRYEVVQGPAEKRSLIGGMGLVYLCMDRKENRPVALKTFKPEYLPDRAARDRFLREGTTWMKLGNHPHVVQAYGVEHIGDGQEMYLVLELVAKVEGRLDASLRSWLTPGKPLLLEQALLFALQIARAMKYATETIPGFVHRDLKPENVLVGADRLSDTEANRLRVTDFGLAAILEAGQLAGEPMTDDTDQPTVGQHRSLLTQTGGIIGTPEYMAPEQWDRRDIDMRADIYAIGCILVEMLTGQIPVQSQSRQACHQLHKNGRALQAVRDLPEIVCPVLIGCLAIEPGRRYPGWNAVESALTVVYTKATGKAAPEPQAAQALNRAERVATGWAQSAIGHSYLDISKYDVAASYFKQAWATGLAEKDRLLEGSGLNFIGSAYNALGDARRAIGYYEQASAVAHEIGDLGVEGVVLNNLGLAYTALGDMRRAMEYLERALAIARQIGDRDLEAATLGNWGVIYKNQGDIERAIVCYERQLILVREIGNQREEASVLSNLGVVHKNLGDMQKAFGFYEQALAIDRRLGDRRCEGSDLHNLGIAYRHLGQADQAIKYHTQALVIAREVGDRRDEGLVLMGLGLAYSALENTSKAIQCYEQSLAVLQEIGDQMNMARAWFNMAGLYARQDDPVRALQLAKRAAQTWEQIGNPSARQARELIAQLQSKG